MAVRGLERVIRNINAEVKKIEGRTTAGLLAAGLKVQAEAQRRTPVDTGNLRASAYTRRAQDDATKVEVGFAAAYALPVHENLEAHHPVGQAKFLESALVDLADEVVRTIADHARVPE